MFVTNNISQTQHSSQQMTQKMGQKQIYSLKLLSMSAEELREEIYSQAAKNPALEIEDDGFESGVKNVRVKNTSSDSLHAGSAGSSGEEKSLAFQRVLESRPDERKTLYEHLMEQLAVAKVTQAQRALCTKIIGNLNEKGFFILAPVSLLDSAAGENAGLLEECLGIVRSFDPAGICAANTQESLLLQALQKKCPDKTVLFLLDGHFEFLDPPLAQKVLKKIHSFVKEQKSLAFNTKDYSFLESLSEDDIQKAVDFIKTLEPFPARGFSLEQAHYIVPEIFVERLPSGGAESEDREGEGFTVRVSDRFLPGIKIASDFTEAKDSSVFARAAIKEARSFLESLEYRRSAVQSAAEVIVKKQLAFFEKGPGHLVPLRRQDVAEEIGVHESTVSRMALSKYLQCEWGLFPVKYFFTNSVSSQNAQISQESVKSAVEKILLEHASDSKPLSDQKISDILAEQGIKVARRTVAKYRSSLKISSSYERF